MVDYIGEEVYMEQDWRMGIAVKSSGRPIALFTTNSYESKVKAEEVFQAWYDQGYLLLSSWIKIDGRVISHRCYVNALGQIKRY